jgi:hypothetical protein
MLRHLAGDQNLVAEINANANCRSFLNEAAREELPHAQRDQIHEEVREERARQEEQPDEQARLGKRSREEIEQSIELYNVEAVRLGVIVKYVKDYSKGLSVLNPLLETNNKHRAAKIGLDNAELAHMKALLNHEKDSLEHRKNLFEQTMLEQEYEQSTTIKDADVKDKVYKILGVGKASTDLEISRLDSQRRVFDNATPTSEGPSVPEAISSAPAAPAAPVEPAAPVVPAVPTLKTLYDIGNDLNLIGNMAQPDIDRILRDIGHNLRGYSRGKVEQNGFLCNVFDPVVVQDRFRDMWTQMTRVTVNQPSLTRFFQKS